MNELEHILERLDLAQYYENFVEEGFDTWDTVLYITESDLDALNVKLGHRRKLQREIAHARGIPFDQLVAQANVVQPPPLSTSSIERGRGNSTNQIDGRSTPPSGPMKRKYRRHPKPDENAPARPPSAYVVFSNEIREELKPQKLSFSEIAKTVGERWQALSSEQKEPYETAANNAKEVFSREMSQYKKTLQYREYMQYLADFKAKNIGSMGEGKRIRFDKELSRASSGSAGSPTETGFEPTMASLTRPSPLARGPSGSSASSASPTSTLPPGGPPPPLPQLATNSPPGPLRHPQLPRIQPLEPRDATVTTPHTGDLHSTPRVHARRTVGAPIASLLRHDTSTSLSSNISAGSTGATSTGSSVFTPITPIEETGPRGYSRSGAVMPLTGSGTSQLGAPHQSPPPVTFHYSPAPMKRLSLDDEFEQQRHPRRLRPDPPDSEPGSSVPASLSHSSQHEQRTSSSMSRVAGARESRQDKMDPLSVLALAGNMVERRPESDDRPP